MWLFEQVGGGRCPIINCSGGTEVAACFLSLHARPLPIKACSLGGPALGMAMDVVDAEGRSLVDTGEVGELVCRRPFPGMTRGFWRDPERYLDTYWRRLPGVWVHGDWASVDEDGYWFLHGRSDDTLNIAGKRIGPAEIESAAVGAPRGDGGGRGRRPARGEGRGRVGLLRRAPGQEPSDELAAEVAESAAKRARQGVQAGPRRSSSRRCRRRAAPRSSAAPCGRRRSARTRATSRPSRTPKRWRPLLAPSEYEGTPTRGYLDSRHLRPAAALDAPAPWRKRSSAGAPAGGGATGRRTARPAGRSSPASSAPEPRTSRSSRPRRSAPAWRPPACRRRRGRTSSSTSATSRRRCSRGRA